MLFEPDDTESLKFVGRLSSDGCTGFVSPYEFSLGWKDGTSDLVTTNVSIAECHANPDSDGVDGRVGNVESALGLAGLTALVNVSLVGETALVLTFEPTVSFIELSGNSTNPFGLKPDRQKKRAFQFATGLTEVSANMAVSGSADIAASVGPIEVEAEIEADLIGSLQLSAGKKNVLLPINDWLPKMKNITLPENAGEKSNHCPVSQMMFVPFSQTFNLFFYQALHMLHRLMYLV